MCTFGELWASNFRVYEGERCTLRRFSLKFFKKKFRQIVSRFTRPFFTKFSQFGIYLIAHYRLDPIFPIAQGTLPWQPISGSKLA